VLFIPEADQPITLEHTGLRRIPGQKNASFVTFRGQANDDAQAGDARLRGVLALTSRAGEIRHVRVDLPLPLADSGASVVMLGEHWLETSPSARAAAVTTRTLPFDPGIGILEAILLALVGGLILNLMPCVLPILAIKVFSVAEMAGRSRRHVLESGAAYAAGILSSMAVLAGVVLALRAVGTQVGWGFQFQSPIFVATIATVLVAFAMNLFGTFEISLNVGAAASIAAEATGARRSFFEGLLAVVLATPCSAPFLGTAVGFAFAGSSFTIVAIFLAIGAGLAAPFLLICLVPAWSRFMPRSGPWMAKLRAGLGFALLATVVWLIWIAGGQSGIEGMTSLLGLLLIVAFGLWIYGALQASGHDWLRVGVGIAVILVAFAGLNLIRMNPGDTGSGSAQELAATADSDWLPWEPAAIRNALDQGHPVLVAFSAEWCITCKVNERVVLQSPRVTSELERLNVSVFKADWTRRDESIRAELSRFGRAGVPMYLVYDPDAPDRPQLLPELLSIGDVVESLRQASRVAERSTPTS
jgi:thiol:disulfide interchange protein DsbD